jgi:hypothetical protein
MLSIKSVMAADVQHLMLCDRYMVTRQAPPKGRGIVVKKGAPYPNIDSVSRRSAW